MTHKLLRSVSSNKSVKENTNQTLESPRVPVGIGLEHHPDMPRLRVQSSVRADLRINQLMHN